MQICASASWGGMEMHVGFLSTHLAGRGHKIIPVCYPGSPLERDLQERGFTPLRLRLGGYFQPCAINKLARWLERQAVDIVHAHYSRDLWTIVPALRCSRRVPLIFTKHIGTQKPKRDFLHRWIYRHVNHVVAISEVIRQNVIATHPVVAERVSVVHHGVDLSRYAPEEIDREAVRSELGLTAEHLVFGIIGRLQVSKGYLEFLEMARRLVLELPQARFLLIGEASRGESSEAEMILGKIREWQLEKVVQHLGFRRDIPRLLAAMDIFVFPSHAEAFGLVLIEAMAMAKPVVSSNCDGVLDIVLDGETGLLVPPRQVEALRQAVLFLARNVEQRVQMGRRARAHVLKFFSLDRMLDAMEFIYHKALSKTAIT
ncbi:MAG: glycosyltransferase family 4 protein [candidate division KSB1 bacterium]|nr:glycosyltransferase family 4 protein [candidate division KSB1 bacterium]MDZ7304050.1 glycosyltransferase family 4 protein [candidate division KSB1 bacterium]MDZ7313239.1 glycosyltransferase family 4 protein [candidate division KSB1 bacterium]